MICLKHERSWLICPTTEVVRLSSFIHSDRADYPEKHEGVALCAMTESLKGKMPIRMNKKCPV